MQKSKRYILTIDAGTTSVRTLLFDTKSNHLINIHGSRISQSYPYTGWVDQDANEIWDKVYNDLLSTIRGVEEEQIFGLGITNQRETIVLWNKETGEPIAPAICWQDCRTEEYCMCLESNPETRKLIYNKTGLIPNSYFSASSLKWLLENCYEAKTLIAQNNLCCGTIDCYLVYRLTEGRNFVTDASNASRTMLYNINTNDWDDDLLKMFGVPRSILPTVVDSNQIIGETILAGKKIGIGGILGDQQASLFGQACFDVGNIKNTYGTGSFMLLNVGQKPKFCENTRLLSTIAWRINGKTTYAIEGSILNAGSCVTWMEESLGLIKNPPQSEELAVSVEDSNGVYFVPALCGLGAPYWDSCSRGMLAGMSLATTKAHIVRSVLEGICYNIRAVFEKMIEDTGVNISSVRVDGGMTKNSFVMQTQADTLQTEVMLSKETECTSIGAAFMSGLAFGAFKDFDDLRNRYKIGEVFKPKITKEDADFYYEEWQETVTRAIKRPTDKFHTGMEYKKKK